MGEEKNEKKPRKRGQSKPKIEDLNMGINAFGELTTNLNLDNINSFLNKNLSDKKLSDDKKDKSKKRE